LGLAATIFQCGMKPSENCFHCLRWSLSEEVPDIGVNRVSHSTIIVIQVGKDCQTDRESVGSKQIARTLSLGNAEELVVVTEVNADW